MHRRTEAVVAALGAVVLAITLAGCSGAKRSAAGPTTPPATPIAQLNTGSMRLARMDFCPLLSRTSVAGAVGSRNYRTTSYRDGDNAQITPTVHDVVHELGCTFTDGTTTARAWLFGLPITPAFARSVRQQAGQHRGCHLSTGPAFGDPTLKQVCRDHGERRVRYAGLFGDTWLTCEVEGRLPLPTLEPRAGAWCVDVATVLNTTH